MSERFLCIHGHFYQPPRENPWLEEVEAEDSAAPFHDWNERIAAECYAPNAVSRLLDADQKIAELANNYAKMSFNFGPTLFHWLERHRPDTYQQIIAADRLSRQQHDGHGNALAQCYNHVIMPLASPRDKVTQVRWGIADFEARFGRKPEGMWLPETAVDLATLEVLAEHGIKFTILAPYQAQAVRPFKLEWADVTGGRIDPTRAYRCSLKKQKSIDLFFYDGPISHDISFAGLLKSGDRFVERLMQGYGNGQPHAQLVHIATDGETFGHHHKFGDMALAYALKKIEREGLARLTNYGEYLALHPPKDEVKIYENTSWSCAHGIERWRSDCGCHGGAAHFHQRWRAPLREALNALQAKLNASYGRHAAHLLREPWKARDDYISVILDRSPQNREAFLSRHAQRKLSGEEKIKTWKLLEMQRHSLLMFTSCGWFFNDISGLETVKVIEYAARAIQLARAVAGVELEPQFVAGLKQAPSNFPQFGDGAKVYEELVKPSVADLKKSLAHYGISSLVEDYAPQQRLFCFEFERADYWREKIGARTLAVGSVKVRSQVTQDGLDGIFAVLHLGGYDFHCAVTDRVPPEEREQLRDKLLRSFAEDSTRDLLRVIETHLGGDGFALKDLFVDERRKIGRLLLEDALEDARSHYEHIYEESRDVMQPLVNLRVPVPEALRMAAEYVLSLRLRQAAAELRDQAISHVELQEVAAAVFREAAALGCQVDPTGLKEALDQAVYLSLVAYRAEPDPVKAERVIRFLKLAAEFGIKPDLWRLQNLFWELLNDARPTAEPAPALAAELGEQLDFSPAMMQEKLFAHRRGLSTTPASGGKVSLIE